MKLFNTKQRRNKFVKQQFINISSSVNFVINKMLTWFYKPLYTRHMYSLEFIHIAQFDKHIYNQGQQCMGNCYVIYRKAETVVDCNFCCYAITNESQFRCRFYISFHLSLVEMFWKMLKVLNNFRSLANVENLYQFSVDSFNTFQHRKCVYNS